MTDIVISDLSVCEPAERLDRASPWISPGFTPSTWESTIPGSSAMRTCACG